MSDLNVVSFTGRLGQDPELRYPQSGKAVLGFSFAVGGRSKQNGEWKDTTTWLRTSAFDKRAEALSKLLRKGSRVAVTGSLVVREFERRDGGKGTSVEVFAHDIVLLDSKRDGEARQGQQSYDDPHAPEREWQAPDDNDSLPF